MPLKADQRRARHRRRLALGADPAAAEGFTLQPKPVSEVATSPGERRPLGLRKVFELKCKREPTGLRFPREMQGQVRTPSQAAEVFYRIKEDDPTESLLALYLDGRHRPIGILEVARGGSNVVHLSPKDLIRPALATGADAMLISHNHPTGDPLPSDEDVELTSRIRAAGDLVGVPLLDHIIVGDDGYFSVTSQRMFRDVWRRRVPEPPAASIFGGALALLAVIIGGSWLMRPTERA